MIPAARPLELRLRSERDVEELARYERLSKQSFAQQLNSRDQQTRSKWLGVFTVAAFLVGVALMTAFSSS